MTKNAQASSSAATEKLLHPVETVTATVSHLPGAPAVKDAFDTVLDTVGVVSPRSRRMAAYAGVGLMGAVGVIEWPMAAAGAAVVWLTQSRSGRAEGGGGSQAGGRAAGTHPPKKTRRSAGR
ncbi:hypothetical protein BIV23_08625 [Streptomyces monashensis]|uniref:Uncharacterized protein n=1 Tax=Streptomyces monashensis TaxID=1678012 RepID=A0A1S2QJT9_9ACTN|nr:hypothetical protein BIV23_08625 [Streptomyces monashensis]